MFLVTAVLLYLFANQTQLGWLYVMAALLAGTVVTALWLGHGTLRSVTVERGVNAGPEGEVFENEARTIQLQINNRGRNLIAQLHVTETCPLVAPVSPFHRVRRFVPALPARSQIDLSYQIAIERRGLHEFPPLRLETRAPFGFFRWQRMVALPTRVLVYPEVRPLRRLRLLDRRSVQHMPRLHAGAGSDVIGIRPFRHGDSPRHVHWRTTARTQQLMSKEFADEARPSVVLALDLFRHPYPAATSKHTPFEWQVKIAASIGDYARRRSYELQILADRQAWPGPTGAAAWPALLQYLARIEPTGDRSLGEVMQTQSIHRELIVLLPWPDMQMADQLAGLRRSAQQTLAIVLNPASFPDGGPAADLVTARLRASGIETREIHFGDDWTEVLGQRDVG